MKSKRNLLLFITVLLFFLTAPVVTLYTAGFRYQWKKERIERVGFFEASTVPSNATVSIDGTTVGKTPYVDIGILPGTYRLQITKPGYRPYATMFDARGGLSTLLLNVLLWKDAEPTLVAPAAPDAVLDPNGIMIAWTQATIDGISAMTSLTNGENQRVACTLKPNAIPSIDWSSSGNAVLFRRETNSGIDGCLMTMSGNTYLLSDIIGSGVRSLVWAPFDDSHLLAQTDTGGFVVAYERKEKKLVAPKGVAFTIRGSRMFGVRSKSTASELFAQPIGTLPLSFGPESVSLPPGEYTFLPSPDRYLVLREEKHGRIDVYDASTLKRLSTVIADSLNFEPTSSPTRFLALNGYELTLYDLKEETSHLITRTSEPIQQAVWHPLGSYALVSTGSQVIALPFERGSRESVTLCRADETHSLFLDKRGNELLILGRIGKQSGVWKLPLKD